MICVLRQIQEECREQNMGIYVAFVDLTKAFDTVSRDGLWKILARLESPSGSFPVSNGVKQGRVLAPTLFSIFFSIMLHEAKEDLPDGIYIRFRTDGSLFNLRRLLTRTKTIEEHFTELLLYHSTRGIHTSLHQHRWHLHLPG